MHLARLLQAHPIIPENGSRRQARATCHGLLILQVGVPLMLWQTEFMQPIGVLFGILVAALLGPGSGSDLGSSTRTTAELVFSTRSTRPGGTTTAAVVLHMPKGWHTYWKVPGDSGGPTTLEWTLPPSIHAGEIGWPTPSKLAEGGLTTYIYEGDVALLVPISVDAGVAPGEYPIGLKVGWLECEKVCVMGGMRLKGSLSVTSEAGPSERADDFARWNDAIPKELPAGSSVSARWEGLVQSGSGGLRVEISGMTGAGLDFFVIPSDGLEADGSTRAIAGSLAAVKTLTWGTNPPPARVDAVLAVTGTDGKVRGYRSVLGPVRPAGSAGVDLAASGGATIHRSLGIWLLFGVIGGFILNFMPCVLPVIALKILGFVNEAGENPAHLRKLGLLYGVGVLASFLVLAGVVIGVRGAGKAASWGMQLQDPRMLVVLTTLVTLVGLNLFGVFEVTLAGGAMGAASNLASREGAAGAFFNGVLATVLATPCTAPFLGAALGFAFTQSAAVILLMFLSVGFGLAFPYVVLCWQPGWMKLLPRPGNWMVRFKMAMGFPMLATAVWLYTLATGFFPEGGDLWLGLFLVLVGFAAWIWGELGQRQRKRQGLSKGIALAVAVAAFVGFLEHNLDWRTLRKGTGGPVNASEGIDWKAWSPEALASARATGKPVFVDFTAKWCLTCQLNKRSSIEIPAVQAKLKQVGAIALLENSPVKEGVVVDELRRHGRAGVPLVLVYPKDATKPPMVLPEILTPGIVLEALDQAVR